MNKAKYQKLSILFVSCLLSFTSLVAQSTQSILREDNNVIRSQTERVADAGWLYFKPNTTIAPGELFTTHRIAAGLNRHDEMVVTKTWDDEYGYSHNRYQQYYKGIKVEGAEYSEHFKNECRLEVAHGKIIENLDINITPSINEREALEAALEEIGAERYAWQDLEWERSIKEESGDRSATYYPEGALLIKRISDEGFSRENYRLSWEFLIQTITPISIVKAFVDVHTGDVWIESAEQGDGPAATLYYGTQTIDTQWRGGFRYNHRLRTNNSGRNIHTKRYQARNWRPTDDVTDNNDVWGTTDAPSTTAHWVVSQAWDYFKNVHGRNGFDGNGGQVRVSADHSDPGAGQFRDLRDNEYIRFGPCSSNNNNNNNTATIDIAGHEFTHGVNRYEGDLSSTGESGALNESFADIFGFLVERYVEGTVNDWTIGEDACLIRSLADPGSIVPPNIEDRPDIGAPDTYLQNPNWYTGTDPEGIYANAGVQNFWFHLLSQGGNHNGEDVQGIGISDVERIVYYSFVNHIQSNSQYADAREAAVWSARMLFGNCSFEHVQTTNAWAACGVGNRFECSTIVIGDDTVCFGSPAPFNYTYTATDLFGSTFTWDYPQQWGVTISGTGNNILTINHFGFPPAFFPSTFTISVASSTGGTDDIQITMYDCGYGYHRECVEIAPRMQTQIEQNVSVSPNPADSELTINIFDELSSEKEIKIMSIDGKVVMNESTKSIQKVLDINQLSPGMYYIKVSGNSYFQTISFIKL